MHTSVLLEPFLAQFREKKLVSFVDATLGAAGHTKALIKEHPELSVVIGFDQDPLAHQIANQELAHVSCRKVLIHSNFVDMKSQLEKHGITHVDGILFDLGVSSMQFDIADRGFSFMAEGPLDMRMDTTRDFCAQDVVNSYSEQDLARIIYEYGEETRSRKIAKAIVQARRKKKITTTQELAAIILEVVPRTGKIHPATKTFQALRIEVNDELGVIQKVIPEAASLLSPGGILGIISFHSLEDRIVKHTFKQLHAESEEYAILTKKPIEATHEEIRSNPRSRSAKLRFLEKISP